jgi:hypothetical protein
MSLIAGNLRVAQRLLDTNDISWGVCAGAAAHLYGDRRPIQDIDILVVAGGLDKIVQLLQREQKAVQFDGKRVLWRGIKFFDDLSVKRLGKNHPFVLDTLMNEHLRHMPLLGAQVKVLAPEDILVHKLLLGRGSEQGKHDLSDAAAIARRQRLDREYLDRRLEISNAHTVLWPKLKEFDILIESADQPDNPRVKGTGVAG